MCQMKCSAWETLICLFDLFSVEIHLTPIKKLKAEKIILYLYFQDVSPALKGSIQTWTSMYKNKNQSRSV